MNHIGDYYGSVKLICTACMSVYSDALSWANKNSHRISMSSDINTIDNIVVLGCQVTDLAILNDLSVISTIKANSKSGFQNFFISGCLANRLDIELPVWLSRVELPRSPGGVIKDKSLVQWEPPFWVSPKSKYKYEDGNLFRTSNPFQTSKGCSGNCSYCTIKHTRGKYEEYPASLDYFKILNDIVLISDSPTKDELVDWINRAVVHNKRISIRNVEPSVLNTIKVELGILAQLGLLECVHCPIQSLNSDKLRRMNRNIDATFEAISFLSALKNRFGVKIATNVIVDYPDVNGDPDGFTDYNQAKLKFDYVSWNPYWDGKFDLAVAQKRFLKYFGKNLFVLWRA